MGGLPQDGKSGTDCIFTKPLPQPEPVPPATEEKPAPKPEKSRLEIALGITGKFEGKGYSQVTGDADQQGLSVGILQWCFGQGSLQEKILRRYIVKHGSVDALKIFPMEIDHLSTSGVTSALKFCRANMLSGTAVKPEWKKAWEQFLTRPEVVALQIENCKGVEASAEKLMKSYGFDSLRAFCWFFDIVTHNGSMKEVPRANPDRAEAERVIGALMERSIGGKDTAKNRTLWREMLSSVNDEQVSLLIMSHQRALLSRTEYYSDVVNRKGSIAMGKGWVHAGLQEYPQLNA